MFKPFFPGLRQEKAFGARLTPRGIQKAQSAPGALCIDRSLFAQTTNRAAQQAKKFFAVIAPVALAITFVLAKISREPLIGLACRRMIDVGMP
jgi:hypothetical protein